MIINTIEDAKNHDQVLRGFTDAYVSEERIYSQVSHLPLHHVTTIIKKLIMDGYVSLKSYPPGRKTYAITDVGKVFLERGGYETQFISSSNPNIDHGTASRDKKRLLFEGITVFLTLGLLILGYFANKSNSQLEFYRDQRDSLSNVVIELKRQKDSLTASINSKSPIISPVSTRAPNVICTVTTSTDQFGTLRYTYQFENTGNKEATELRAVVKALSPAFGAVEFGHGNWNRSNTSETEGIQFWNFVFDHPLGIAEKATIVVAVGADYIKSNQEKGLPILEARHLGGIISVQGR